jgi:D-alanyl-D-alanine endopeptidase (penicillin-binding protein 7)
MLREILCSPKLGPPICCETLMRPFETLLRSRAVLVLAFFAAVAALAMALAGPVAAQTVSDGARKSPTKESARARPQRARSATARPSPSAARPAGRRVAEAPARPSMGQLGGLHAVDDPLDLKSSVALVVDQESDQVLLSKNPDAVLPIASITKLMTALVVVEAQQPLDERLTISEADIDTAKGSRSRLTVGTRLSRGEMLQLALMASENRAANALGRHYPGGIDVFVGAMNAKAQLIGMNDTRYVEPTGLSSENRSSAKDLALLVRAASEHQLIRELSTAREAQVPIGQRQMEFRNTNGLVRNPRWSIDLQKTGYISEAGRCVVMQAELYGRKLIMVLLDSAGKYSRIADAERIRGWLATAIPAAIPAAYAAERR